MDKEEKRLVEDFRELIKLQWQPYKITSTSGSGSSSTLLKDQLNKGA